MEFIVIILIISYLIMKNNSLKKSLLDKSKKLESLELELNTNTNSNTNLPHKTTDEIIDSV